MSYTIEQLNKMDLSDVQTGGNMPPVHPGNILQTEFLEPTGTSQYRLAKCMAVPPVRINEIIKGRRNITADTALRLAKALRTSAQFWLGLQTQYDLDIASADKGEEIEKEVTSL